MKLHNLRIIVLSGLVSTAAARSGSRHEKPKLPPTKVENFTWSDPFAKEAIGRYKVACEAERTFSASEFLLHDLYEDEPLGLWPYAGALRKFFIGRPYPGSWDGMDPHQYDRSMLKMTYSDLPVEVREWIEMEERTQGKGKGLFAVYEKPEDTKTQVKGTAELPLPEKAAKARAHDDKRITIFAPGALYEILPLFVAGNSNCKGDLLDLTRYSQEINQGAVVGWIQHKAPDRSKSRRNVEFTIRVQMLENGDMPSAGQDSMASGKDEL